MMNAWYSFCVKTIDKHAPIKTHRIKNENQPDWVTSDILDKIKQRDNLTRFDVYETLCPNRCLYIKVAKLRTGVGSAETSYLQNCNVKLFKEHLKVQSCKGRLSKINK